MVNHTFTGPPLLLLLFLNPVSRFAIDQRPGRFLSIRFLLLFFPTNDPTDEPSPFRAGFQLFALHISPTFASNLKSCSRQILNLFRKNRAPRIFHLSARARVQSSMARLMNLTLKRAKSTGNISSKRKICIWWLRRPGFVGLQASSWVCSRVCWGKPMLSNFQDKYSFKYNFQDKYHSCALPWDAAGEGGLSLEIILRQSLLFQPMGGRPRGRANQLLMSQQILRWNFPPGNGGSRKRTWGGERGSFVTSNN